MSVSATEARRIVRQIAASDPCISVPWWEDSRTICRYCKCERFAPFVAEKYETPEGLAHEDDCVWMASRDEPEADEEAVRP